MCECLTQESSVQRWWSSGLIWWILHTDELRRTADWPATATSPAAHPHLPQSSLQEASVSHSLHGKHTNTPTFTPCTHCRSAHLVHCTDLDLTLAKHLNNLSLFTFTETHTGHPYKMILLSGWTSDSFQFSSWFKSFNQCFIHSFGIDLITCLYISVNNSDYNSLKDFTSGE